ncbi:MAG TPA: DUF4397 domain-containing protein [Gemmatimonadales bacterium]
MTMTPTTFRPIALAALLAAGVLAGCTKYDIEDPTASLPGAQVMFFNFGVGAPQVNFYADATKLTAIYSGSGIVSNAGTPYGSVAAGGLYAGVAAGSYTLNGRIADTTYHGFVVASANAAIADGKAYSFYMSGFYNATDTSVDAFVVEDPIPATLVDTMAYVRFVNAIGNADSLQLYVRLNGDTVTADWMPVDSVVTYKSAGAYTALPALRYDLGARLPDSTTNTFSRTGVSFAGGHAYTVTARGNITVSTGTTAHFLDSTENR